MKKISILFGFLCFNVYASDYEIKIKDQAIYLEDVGLVGVCEEFKRQLQKQKNYCDSLEFNDGMFSSPHWNILENEKIELLVKNLAIKNDYSENEMKKVYGEYVGAVRYAEFDYDNDGLPEKIIGRKRTEKAKCPVYDFPSEYTYDFIENTDLMTLVNAKETNFRGYYVPFFYKGKTITYLASGDERERAVQLFFVKPNNMKITLNYLPLCQFLISRRDEK